MLSSFLVLFFQCVATWLSIWKIFTFEEVTSDESEPRLGKFQLKLITRRYRFPLDLKLHE